MKKISIIKVLEIIKKMSDLKILDRWAIGGAVAVMFYTEPYLTKDIDVFIIAHITNSGIIDMSGIYDWLKKRGYDDFEGQSVLIEGVRVDFVPVFGLTEEAVRKARFKAIGETKVKVITPEYLIAIALSVGRTQDYFKIDKLLGQCVVKNNILDDIIRRHDLYEKWQRYIKGSKKSI
ncbi:MAG: nucleotidyltransferase [Deltaproteobacteria bacterium]|nr:nucleotidyltransferase [Deltaproteobacteria bacterium]